ncbi:Uncharacterised protein [uncultured Clostridium sp.]|nr:Uncharacterised protein [uncultured Clostridium sp.]
MPNYEPKTCQNLECHFRKICRVLDDIDEKDCAHYIPPKPDPVPIKWEKEYSDSTLMGFTKKQLIEYIHCLVNNNNVLQETVNEQAKTMGKLFDMLKETKKVDSHEKII